MGQYVLAMDQGTTSSRAVLFGHAGNIVAVAQQEFPQILPQPGHVEHDPEAIWDSQLATARNVLKQAEIGPQDVAAIGITNQRETTILWDAQTGKPVGPAIVWQSRVTADLCAQLKADGVEPVFREKTGLVMDAYFSGTKIKHLLDNQEGLRARAERGEILFGTVDTFLMWRLTGGAVHVTDYSNASRTLIFNIHTLDWDDELLKILDVPRAMLPEVKASSCVYGETTPEMFGQPIPIAGVAGDQQAATFGQACFTPGMAKNTYGTGCFMLMNTGTTPVASQNQLLTTIGWGLNDEVVYCLEGSIFIAGAVVQWLRDGLGLIANSSEVEALAASVDDSDGVIVVPAFVGLGAPYWDASARGAILGLTRGTQAGHLARAAVESMAFQTRDVLDAMMLDADIELAALRVDGGASVNDSLMQFQADLLDVVVRRPVVSETTALGVAYLAGLAVDYWHDTNDVTSNWALDREFAPQMEASEADQRYAIWKQAVERIGNWQ